MKDSFQTKQELIEEISLLKKKIKKLEKSEKAYMQTNDAFRESELRFRAQYQGNPIPTFTWQNKGDDFELIDFNDAAKDITDGKVIDFIGRKASDLYANQQDILQDIQRSFFERAIVRRETQSKHFLPGRLTSITIVFVPVDLVIVYLEDITERKRADETLQKSEDKYRTLIETTDTGFVIIDQDGGVLDANSEYVRLTGHHDLSEIVGRSVMEWTADYEKEKNAAAVKACFEQGYIRNLEIDYVDAKGKVTPIEINASCIEIEGKIQTITICRDITKRKQAEEVLRESETKLQTIFNKVGTGIFIIDRDALTIIEANQTAIEMTGLSKERIIGQICNFVVCPALAGKCQVKDLDQNIHQSERKLLHADGHQIDILKTVYPITIKGRNCYLESFIDISDRKRAEEEKRNLEERLQRAEKMEALGTLAGGVAHDLNNVLGVIVGYAELLLNEVDKTSSIRPRITKILNGSEKAATIVQDLLTLARRGVSGRKVLNLNKLILDYQNSPEFEKLSSYHFAVRIKLNLESDLLNISGSSVHLGKTLFNLILNAVEAMPKGGELIIKTANQYLDKPVYGYDEIREGDYVALSVMDTGEGMPSADLQRIFEPFYTKKVMGRSGTGLGLAVVWGTVKDHQGYINVNSEEGKGSTFTLYFPVTREDVTSVPASVSSSEYMGKGETILVVDDVREQCDLAAEMLKKLNYKVFSVASGEEAVEYLKEHKVDLLVLDMIMEPGQDGLDTYRSVLKIQPQQKAIIVSGFSETDRVHATQTLGAGEYVKKPYVIEKLGMAVRKELDRK
jgi:PAS domain S-box-containing protein